MQRFHSGLGRSMRFKLCLGWTILGCCGLLVALATGCDRWIELKPTADSDPAPFVRAIARDEQVPFVIDSIATTRNSSPQNPSLETEQRVLGTLRKIGLFSHFYDMNSLELSPSQKFIHAHLLFDKAIDPHPGRYCMDGHRHRRLDVHPGAI